MALHVKCLVSGFDGAENVQKVDFHEVSNAFTTIERRQSFHFEERCHSRFSAAGGSRAFRWQASGFQHFSGSSCQCVTFLSSSPVLGGRLEWDGCEFQLCLCTKKLSPQASMALVKGARPCSFTSHRFQSQNSMARERCLKPGPTYGSASRPCSLNDNVNPSRSLRWASGMRFWWQIRVQEFLEKTYQSIFSDILRTFGIRNPAPVHEGTFLQEVTSQSIMHRLARVLLFGWRAFARRKTRSSKKASIRHVTVASGVLCSLGF